MRPRFEALIKKKTSLLSIESWLINLVGILLMAYYNPYVTG